MPPVVSRLRAPRALGLVVFGLPLALVAATDEPVPTFIASDLLSAALVSGPHHKVAQPVRTEGFFHEFTLTSDFGPFEAIGLSELSTRVDEIRALAALQDVSKSEVFAQAAGGALLNIGKSAAHVVTDPAGAAKGLGAGVKRLGVNLGRVTKRTADSAGSAGEPGPPAQDSGAESAANSVLGVSSAMRRWAQKVGADPYTTNRVLWDALKDIARIDAAGSIATKVVVPIPTVVSTSASVGGLVWGKDPEELRKLNEQRAKGLGVSAADAGAFFKNRWFTLTMQMRLVAALDAVKVPGAGGYLKAASRAVSDREALFLVESAEMLQRVHAKAPVRAVLTDSRALVAREGTRAVALLPLDYVRSTRETREALAEIAVRARKELGATQLILQITGRMSSLARDEARALGWTVTERVSMR